MIIHDVNELKSIERRKKETREKRRNKKPNLDDGKNKRLK